MLLINKSTTYNKSPTTYTLYFYINNLKLTKSDFSRVYIYYFT